MLSRSSRNDGPPSIWDTHGISGNVFANPHASSSAPYPQELDPKPFYGNAEPQRRAREHLWHAWFFGKLFCRSGCVFYSTLSTGIESMEFRHIRTDSLIIGWEEWESNTSSGSEMPVRIVTPGRSPHSPSFLVDWDFGAHQPVCLLGELGWFIGNDLSQTPWCCHWISGVSHAGPPSLVAAHTTREELSGVLGFEPLSCGLLFRVLLLRRFRLPTARTCRCGRQLDSFGLGCWRSGGLLWRMQWPEFAAKVAPVTHVMVRDLDVLAPQPLDSQRLEVVAEGLPLSRDMQFAIDATLVSPAPLWWCCAQVQPTSTVLRCTALDTGMRALIRNLLARSRLVGARWPEETNTFARP